MKNKRQDQNKKPREITKKLNIRPDISQLLYQLEPQNLTKGVNASNVGNQGT